MRIGGWIAASWAIATWVLLIAAGPLGRMAAVCVFVQSVIQFRTVARHATLVAATVVFAAAAAIAAHSLASPLTDVVDAAARLIAIVLVPPLVSEFASGFWLCRVLQRSRVPRPFSLAIFSSLSVTPLLFDNVATFRYHHSKLQRSGRLATMGLTAAMVMALDRVQELEVVEYAFDTRALLQNAPGKEVSSGELVYVGQLLVMASLVFLILR